MLPIAGVLASAGAWAHAPLTDSTGQVAAWPAEAWPLPLASRALPDRRAAAAWTAAGDVAWAPEEPAPLGPDGRVAVAVLAEAAWAETVGDPALVAFTLITHTDGQLDDADVVLNGARFAFVDPPEPRVFSRQAVVAHELGHVIGLGHPCGEPGGPTCEGTLGAALMAPRLAAGDHRGPGVDDVAGLEAWSTYEGPVRRPAPNAPEWQAEQWGVAMRLEAGDRVEHARERAVISAARDSVWVPADVASFEIWTTAGQGVVVDRPERPLEAEADQPEPAEGGGCAVHSTSATPLWMLALMFGRRRMGRA